MDIALVSLLYHLSIFTVLHYQFKKSVWNELGDISPLIDVSKLEEYFATKPTVVKDLNKNSKSQENKALLDPKRSQNIGKSCISLL